MKMKSTYRLSALALALAAPLAAHAAEDLGALVEKPWYIMPQVGMVAADNDWQNGINNGPALGLKFGKSLSPNWDIQFGVNAARAKKDATTYKQTTLGVDALYLIGGNAVKPFFLAGLGGERDERDLPGSITKTSPYLNYGAGLQYMVSDRFGLQGDIRRVVGFYGNTGPNNFGTGASTRNYNTYFNLGLMWLLGDVARPAPPKPVAAVVPPPPPAPVAPPPPPPPPPVAPPPPPRPAPPPPPPPAPVMQKFTIGATELFAFDSANLRLPQPRLDEIAGVLNANPQIGNVVVSGHTDRLGSAAYNQPLSQRRADAVKRYLESKGVSASRLQAVGRASTQPVVQCSDANRAALIKCLEPNRRVEIEPVTYTK